MGWEFSVAVLQQVQRTLAEVAQLPKSREIRSDAILPDMRTGLPAWAYYVDNFDEIRVCSAHDPHTAHEPTAFQLNTRAVKAKLGIPQNFDKTVEQSTKTETLGFVVDGVDGRVGVHVRKRRVLFRLGLELVSLALQPGAKCGPPRGALSGFLGKGLHAAMVQRPSMAVFAEVFSTLPRVLPHGVVLPPRSRFSFSCALELLTFSFLLPLLECNLRRPFHPK